MKTATGGGFAFRPAGARATYAIIGLSLGVFVLSWLMQGKLFEPLAFWNDWSHPWGIVTYPFASLGEGRNLFFYLLTLYWLFWVGTSAESDLGIKKFVAFFVASGAVAAISIWLGLLLIHPGLTGPILAGLELCIGALTVAWGSRHPHQSILLFAIIPIPGWLLAWLTVALTLFGFGSEFRAPLMGAFACVHLGLAYLFAMNRIPGLEYSQESNKFRQMKATERRDKKYFEEVRKREQERDERERLRKLFERSMIDDSENK